MEINGRTGFFCLIGSPVGHSGSPAMYNYSFQNRIMFIWHLTWILTRQKRQSVR